MLTTKVLPCGSLKAVPSRIGKHRDHCCGSTENVHLSPSAASLLLTDFRIHSRFRQECTQARPFRLRLIRTFMADDPTARRLSTISNPSATQDPLMSPTFSMISRTRESRMPAPYFALFSFNSAINPHPFVTFSLPAIHPTNVAPNNPATTRSINALKMCSKHQDPPQYISSSMPWMNVPTRRSFRRHAKRCWSSSRTWSS